MPGGDKTGPFGSGPMTGRRLGFCSGDDNPGYYNQYRYGRDRERGTGWHRGNRFRYRNFERDIQRSEYQAGPAVNQKAAIEHEMDILKKQLSYLENQLTKLGKNK